MPKAVWNGRVIAASEDTVMAGGTHYFPREAVETVFLSESRSKSVCLWKGVCSYYTLEVDGQSNEDAAFYYPRPSFLARKIKGRIAFWKGVQIEP